MTGYSVYALLEKYFPLDRMVLFFVLMYHGKRVLQQL